MPEKRDSRDTGHGRRLGYLSNLELGKHIQIFNRDLCAQSRLSWSYKARLA